MRSNDLPEIREGVAIWGHGSAERWTLSADDLSVARIERQLHVRRLVLDGIALIEDDVIMMFGQFHRISGVPRRRSTECCC